MEKENFHSKFKLWIKVVALTVIMAFMWEEVVRAQGGTPVFLTQKMAGRLEQKDLNSFAIPADIGAVRKIHRGESEETIIHVQDAHDSLTAQESIVKILENLLNNYDVKLIAQEGSAGYIDTSFLATFPIEDIKQKTARHFMEQGTLSAAEFFTICSKEDIALYGIEDEQLYSQDLDSFKYIIEQSSTVLGQIKSLKSSLEALQPRVYTPDIIDLTKNSALHKNGKIAFTEHWNYISKLANKAGVPISDYNNIEVLLKAVSLEKQIDFAKADSEKEAAVKLLSEKLPKPDLEKFLLEALSFKAGKITKGDFYAYLKESAEKAGVDLSGFKELSTYIQYITLYEGIDILEIFNEMAAIEDAIKEKLFTTQEQRDLYGYSKFVDYLQQLFEAKLLDPDFAALVKLNSGIKAQDIAGYLRDSYSKYNLTLAGGFDIGAIFAKVPKAMEFYAFAEKRNEAIINNTIARMRENKQTVAALITGGFHTQGVTELLKENKLSYLVIMPHLNQAW